MPWRPFRGSTTKSQLKYKKLQSRQIRLLKLHRGHPEDELKCDLIVRSLDTHLSYEAVSYVWGVATQPIFLDCSDGYVRISPNLEKGLRVIRKRDRPRLIWADQVCINQSDTAERSIQVGIMGDIFKQAFRVIMWLGPDDDTDPKATVAANFIRRIVQLPQDIWAVVRQITDADLAEHGLPPASAPEWEAFNALLAVAYWSRVWIYQEIHLAQDREMLWGSVTIPWEHFCKALKYLLLNTYLHRNAGARLDSWQMTQGQVPRTQLSSADLAAINSVIYRPNGESLHVLLTIVSSRSATDTRDKVYGVLGLLKGGRDYFTVDYTKSLRDIFTEAAIYMLKQEGRIRFLGNAGLMNRDPEQSLETWPSWLPCWRDSDPVYLMNTQGQAQGHLGPKATWSNAEPGILNVTGIVLDRISHKSDWYENADASIRKTWYFFQKHARRSSKEPFIKSFLNAAMCGTYAGTHEGQKYGWHDETYAEYAVFQGSKCQRALLGGIGTLKPKSLADWQESLVPGQAALLAAHNRHPVDLEYGTTRFTRIIKAFEDEFWREEVENSGRYAQEAEQLRERLRPEFANTDDLQAAVKMFIVFQSVKGDALHFYRRYHQTNQGRELFITDNGTVGMGPKQLQQPGDLVVIFGGYRAPCIIRPLGDRYRLLGDCYFEGAMYGEKVRQLESRGKLEDAQMVFPLF